MKLGDSPSLARDLPKSCRRFDGDSREIRRKLNGDSKAFDVSRSRIGRHESGRKSEEKLEVEEEEE